MSDSDAWAAIDEGALDDRADEILAGAMALYRVNEEGLGSFFRQLDEEELWRLILDVHDLARGHAQGARRRLREGKRAGTYINVVDPMLRIQTTALLEATRRFGDEFPAVFHAFKGHLERWETENLNELWRESPGEDLSEDLKLEVRSCSRIDIVADRCHEVAQALQVAMQADAA